MITDHELSLFVHDNNVSVKSLLVEAANRIARERVPEFGPDCSAVVTERYTRTVDAIYNEMVDWFGRYIEGPTVLPQVSQPRRRTL